MRRGLRAAAASAAVTLLSVAAVAGPAAAAGAPVHMEVMTSFSSDTATFTADLDGCESGSVTNRRVGFPPSRGIGVFTGNKQFACSGDQGGFDVKLTARFPVGSGSAGTWAVQSSWGTMAELRASGSLVGFGSADGILDVYDGTVHR